MKLSIIKEALIENQPNPVDIEGTKKILSQMENCICKIYQDGKKGTGFFCKIPFPDKNNLLNVLITNNHILNQKDIEDNQIIKLTMYNKEENKNIEKNIKIDESRKRYTYINDGEGIDITIIEIKPKKDNINNYLEIDDDLLDLECNKKSIYILHYPKDKKLVSYGLINDVIGGKKINHYCNTEEGSSGSPILSLNTHKIIGVHYGSSNKKSIKLNYGTYIKYIINEFNNKYKNEIKNIGIKDTNLKATFFIKKKSQNNKIVKEIKTVFNKDQLILFYDVIVNIKSLKDINKGWFIKINNANYKKYKNEKTTIIGVIGNSNKGKSFLVSKISKDYLPSGIKIKTKGLCFKYPKSSDRRIALIDTVGLEKPILKEEEKDNLVNEQKIEIQKQNLSEDEREEEYERRDKKEDNEKIFYEKSKEKILTELFLQNYIFYNSNIIIIVVGILNYYEQKLLYRIKKEIFKNKNNKSLFIIHNLMTYTTEEQVEDYIKEVLLKNVLFNLEEGHTEINSKSGKYFYEKMTNFPVFHLLFANEDSKAGNIYNEFTLQFLENNYLFATDLKPFDIVKTIKDRFTEIAKDIIEQPEAIKFDDSKEDIIKLDCPKDIIFKRYFMYADLTLKSDKFIPVYNYYEKDDKIVVKIEAPGNCNLLSSRVDFSGEYTIINISGEKRQDKEPKYLSDNLFNNRKMGFFSLGIPLLTKEFLLKNESPLILNKKGVFILEFKLEKTKNKIEFKYDEEDEI